MIKENLVRIFGIVIAVATVAVTVAAIVHEIVGGYAGA